MPRERRGESRRSPKVPRSAIGRRSFEGTTDSLESRNLSCSYANVGDSSKWRVKLWTLDGL